MIWTRCSVFIFVIFLSERFDVEASDSSQTAHNTPISECAREDPERDELVPLEVEVKWNLKAPCHMSGFFNELVTVLVALEPKVSKLSLQMGRCTNSFLSTMLPPTEADAIRRLQRGAGVLAQLAAFQQSPVEGNVAGGPPKEPVTVDIHHHHVCHHGSSYHPSVRPRAVIARHMCEEMVLHRDAARCLREPGRFDAVWVPTAWHKELYEAAGVSSVRVVPNAIDISFFDPSVTSHLIPRDNSEVFTFLSVFKWEHRKGWDILLDAYWRTFERGRDNVVLRIVSYAESHDRTTPPDLLSAIEAHAAAWLLNQTADHGGRGTTKPFDILPRTEWITISDRGDPSGVSSRRDVLSRAELRAEYATADCFVLPTRGEGFNLPTAEAMAMGVNAVIVTNFSGPADFIGDGPDGVSVALPLQVDGTITHASGLVEPSRDHLQSLMKQAHTQRGTEEARRRGVAARSRILERFSPATVAAVVAAELEHVLLEAAAN